MTRPLERMVTLADGREVSNYSDAFRHECECLSFLASYPTRSAKHLYLYGVTDRAQLFWFNHKTGKNELKEMAEIRSLWSKSKPLMHWRGLDGADKILADAKRLYELGARAS